MGCCFCHSLSKVENDPKVSDLVTVGDIGIYRGMMSVIRIQGCCNGIMYIKNDSLYYETKYGGALCCSCFRQRFRLSDIKKVEPLPYGPITIAGLKITVVSPSQIVTTVLVVMPDAATFSPQLGKACQKYTNEYEADEYKADEF